MSITTDRPTIPATDPISPPLGPFPSPPDSCDTVKCLDGGFCVMEEVS